MDFQLDTGAPYATLTNIERKIALKANLEDSSLTAKLFLRFNSI